MPTGKINKSKYLGSNEKFAHLAEMAEHELIGTTDQKLFWANFAPDMMLNDQKSLSPIKEKHL